jgi:hypothetical protein
MKKLLMDNLDKLLDDKFICKTCSDKLDLIYFNNIEDKNCSLCQKIIKINKKLLLLYKKSNKVFVRLRDSNCNLSNPINCICYKYFYIILGSIDGNEQYLDLAAIIIKNYVQNKNNIITEFRKKNNNKHLALILIKNEKFYFLIKNKIDKKIAYFEYADISNTINLLF